MVQRVSQSISCQFVFIDQLVEEVEEVEVFRDESVSMNGLSQTYVTIGSNHSPSWTSSNVAFSNLHIYEGQ